VGENLIDLNDVTFNVPVRLDSAERKKNIEILIKYLKNHFETHIIICEESREKQLAYVHSYGCKYIFIPSMSPLLYRTKCLNMMTLAGKTPIVCNCDCDVLFPLNQYVEAVQRIRNGSLDACFPYDGRFYDVPRKYFSMIETKLSLSHISTKNCRLLNRNSLGGALFWNKQSFIEGGMENERFHGWGYEDNELIERFSKLGYQIGRVEGSLFHLEHPRKFVSSFNSLKKMWGYLKYPQLMENKREYKKVKSLSKESLRVYVESWKSNK